MVGPYDAIGEDDGVIWSITEIEPGRFGIKASRDGRIAYMEHECAHLPRFGLDEQDADEIDAALQQIIAEARR